MKRRDFLLQLSSVIPAASIVGAAARSDGAEPLSAASPPPGSGWRTFEIATTVEISEPAGRTLLWIPLPSSARTDYQRFLDVKYTVGGAGGRVDMLTAPGYDVTLMRVEWTDPKSTGPVTLVNRVATCDREVNIGKPGSQTRSHETPATLQTYLRPTKLLPTDGIVRETAEKITRDARGDVEKARALCTRTARHRTAGSTASMRRRSATRSTRAKSKRRETGSSCAGIRLLTVAPGHCSQECPCAACGAPYEEALAMISR
jgi:hypothetical protein